MPEPISTSSSDGHPAGGHGGMRRDANGAGDFFAPVEIGEEMLAEALASHERNSVARGAKRRREATK